MGQVVLEVNVAAYVTVAALGAVSMLLVLFLFWTTTWFFRHIFIWVAFGLLAVVLIALFLVYLYAIPVLG